MVTAIQQQPMIQDDQEQRAVFYMERILEQADSKCLRLAKMNFQNYRPIFSKLLSEAIFLDMEKRISIKENWNTDIEKDFLEKVKNAWTFGEHKVVHDLAHEIILHHQHPADSCSTHNLHDEALQILAANNGIYLEPDEVEINTILDAKISFLVDQRRARSSSNKPLKGNPGFHIADTLENNYRCFVKQVEEVDIGQELKLKITNIPGLAITNRHSSEPIIYLEPRVVPGQKIEVELLNLSHTGNSFTFRHHSYDGFLWFKRRGVNKEIFNKNTLCPKDRIIAKVLYTTEEVKRSPKGNITRLGIIKAVPVKRIEAGVIHHDDQDIDAAKALS